MENNKEKKKVLFYSVVVIMLLLSIAIFKYTISANSEDNKVAIGKASITSIKTGTASFDSSDGVVEDNNGNITSFTAGSDSSDSNRLVRSYDELTYNFDFTIKGKNDENAYYSKKVDITVSLSEDEARYIGFTKKSAGGEQTKTFTFDNISSTSLSNTASITLYVLGAPNGTEISPKFTIKESTDRDTPVVLGKNDSNNLDYKYEDGQYTNTNRSTVTNYMPTIVSSVKGTLSTNVYPSSEGQKATYDGQVGRYFTEVVELYTENTKGKYFDNSLSYNLTYSHTGLGTILMDAQWVRLYNTSKVGDINPVVVNTAYSNGAEGTANNETRFPGTVSYSNGQITISNFNVLNNYPGVSASRETISGKNVVGTYAITVFSPRIADDGKNDITVTVNAAGNTNQFINKYYESTDYNLSSGFYNENGNERLTKSVDLGSAKNEALSSSTSKGSTITYKTEFKNKQTLVSTGLKEVIKVDPIAFRVLPYNSKNDIDISVSCGDSACNISKDNFEVKFVTGDFKASDYSITNINNRLAAVDTGAASSQCNILSSNLSSYSRDQIMNLYGGPCLTGNNEATFTTINSAKNNDSTEIPITKIIVQTKEGVVLPANATVTVLTKLRVRNVSDITRSYQASVVASTSDYDSVLEYFAPRIADSGENNILNPDNYTRSTFSGDAVTINSNQKYADSIRIVNFTARQDITVTNTLSDGQPKSSFAVDDNETITYKISTHIEDLNQNVGADDGWYIKNVKVNVTIPSQYLEYIEDSSLGNPEVIDNGDTVTLVYTLPWTKPNMKISDIYFKAKLQPTISGTAVPITVTSTLNPMNINGEYDRSVVDAKKASYTIYGTGSQTVLVSQTNEGKSIVDKNTEFTYLLNAHNNSSNDVTNYILQDILPYNKDDRGSSINGTYEVKVTLPSSQPNAVLYCSTKDSKNISKEVLNTNDEFNECTPEEYVKATAIRITGINLSAGQTMDPIKVTIKPKDNKFGNSYVNKFIGGNREFKEKTSNNIKFSVISRSISGIVFYDSDQDGVRSDDEKYASGIAVTLYKIENGTLKKVNGGETTTDKNGAYKFKNLEAGLYKVRFLYNSGKYDLALRYGTEDTSRDSDAYKISEGTAEISGKHTPKQVDGLDLTVFDNYKIENMDMGLIPRNTFGFEMKKYITQIDLNYNDSITSTKYDNKSEVTLNVRNTLKATAKVYYGMSITNNSSRAGYVKLVQEDIPEGLIFDSTDTYNSQWFEINGVLQSNYLEDKLISPGETVYLKIALNMPQREEAGTFINTVSVLEIEKLETETIKEAEYTAGSGYTIGEAVTYAGVNWHVIGKTSGEEDSEEVLTLLADSGTISNKLGHTNGSIYKWSESSINSYINDAWLEENSINTSSLKDVVICDDPSSLNNTSFGGTIEGSCTSNIFVTNKIRLLTEAEYNLVMNANLSDVSWLYGNNDFWLMDAVDSTINHNYYGVQTNTDVNLYSRFVSKNNSQVNTGDASSTKEVRPVIVVSSKNINNE